MNSQIVAVSVGIFIRRIEEESCQIWTQVRDEDGPLNGLWEFPGGKIEKDETPHEAVLREICEETGIKVEEPQRVKLFKLYPYKYNDRQIHMYVHWLINVKAPEHGNWLTVKYGQYEQDWFEKIPAANHMVVRDLDNYLVNSKNREIICTLY